MIVSLKFSNFKSYRDTAEFSFEALDSDFNVDSVTAVTLNDGSIIRLLNAAVIFGANASGKSNVIHALDTLVKTVRKSLSYTVSSHPSFIFPYAFDRMYANKATTIELDFIFKGRRFLYTVAGKKDSIQKESLKEIIRSSRNKVVFNRKADNTIETGTGWPSEKKTLVDDSNLLPNQLMLSWIATKSLDGLQDVASYVGNLAIYWGSTHAGAYNDRQLVMETIVKDTSSTLFRQLIGLMQIADLGVATIKASRNDDKAFMLPDVFDSGFKQKIIDAGRWNVALGHSTSNPEEICILDFGAESEGTKALFGVGARLLAALQTGAFVAYDEINDAIHPALLRFLVSLFQSKISNPKGAQLLFSTHDSSVADHNTLRADQVWFVEKKDAVSDLYSAQDFEDVDIRVPFEGWYRAGRFGALPSIGDLEMIFKN